jgi:hypothetical protein
MLPPCERNAPAMIEWNEIIIERSGFDPLAERIRHEHIPRSEVCP